MGRSLDRSHGIPFTSLPVLLYYLYNTIIRINPILKYVGEFIPVKSKLKDCEFEDTLLIDDVYKEIFENEYLKYKNKYVLYDCVVEKVKFLTTVTRVYSSKTINHNVYKILSE